MDQIMNSMLNENGIILNKLIDVFSNIKYDKNNKLGILSEILLMLPKIFGILLSKYAVTNINKVTLVSLRLLKRLLCTRIEYNTSDKKSLGPHISKILSKLPSGNILYWIETEGLKIYTYKPRFIPYSKLHYEMIEQAKDESKKELSVHASCSKLMFDKTTIVYKTIIPNKMFPSDNFKRLNNIINKSIESSVKKEYYQIIPILIDGEPGLGKTKSIDYIAYYSQIQTIRKIDMTNFIGSKDTELRAILDMISKQLSDHTLILIDEIDKYISVKCQQSDDPQKTNEELLNNILTFIEQDPTGYHCVFIVFCSNNFTTIFDNLSEQSKIHHYSLYNRFFKLHFNRINKSEFCEYIKWLGNGYPEDLINNIPEDFNITFRELRQHSLLCFEDPIEICNTIKNTPAYIKQDVPVIQKKVTKIDKVDKPVQKEVVKINKPIEQPIIPANISVLKEKNRRNSKDYYTTLLGPNNFTEKEWNQFDHLSEINSTEFCKFIIDNKDKLINIDKDYFRDIVEQLLIDEKYEILKMLLIHEPKVIQYLDELMRNIIDGDNLCNYSSMIKFIPDWLIECFKLYKTCMFESYTKSAEESSKIEIDFITRFNIPGQITLLEWLQHVRFIRVNTAKLSEQEIIEYLNKCEEPGYHEQHIIKYQIKTIMNRKETSNHLRNHITKFLEHKEDRIKTIDVTFPHLQYC